MDVVIGIVVVIAMLIVFVANIIIKSAEEKRAEDARRKAIYDRVDKYGEEICLKLIEKRVSPGMTKNMVVLSWGKPASIDQREITKTGIEKERWVYGRPRRGASYVYFKNGTVDKIKQ